MVDDAGKLQEISNNEVIYDSYGRLSTEERIVRNLRGDCPEQP